MKIRQEIDHFSLSKEDRYKFIYLNIDSNILDQVFFDLDVELNRSNLIYKDDN